MTALPIVAMSEAHLAAEVMMMHARMRSVNFQRCLGKVPAKWVHL